MAEMETQNDGPVDILVNGARVTVPSGTVVAAAVALGGGNQFRRSVTGEPRAPLCGMGICFECRVTIDGRANLRSCNILAREGMQVKTDD